MECFQSGCKTKPIFYCTCTKNVEYCCSNHMPNHLAKPRRKKHKFFSTLKNLAPDMRVPIIGKLKESIADFKVLQRNIIKISSDFNSLIIECVKKIDKIIQYHKILLRETVLNEQVNLITSYHKKYRENSLGLEMLQLNKKEQFKNMNFDKIIKNTENFQNLLASTQDQFIKPYNDTFLYYFINDTKSLVRFNTKNFTFQKKTIEDLQPVGRRASVYYLNDGNIFCYGGGNSQTISSTFYIDSKTFAITRLPNGERRHSVRPVLVKGRIYVFGGCTDRLLNSANYFDINRRKWTEVAKLPSNQSDTSPVKIQSRIILTGCDNFFQSYETNLDMYTNLNSGIPIDRYSILLKNKSMIFVLCKKIYYSKKTKLKEWISHPSKTVAFDMNSSIPVIRSNRAYFIDENYQIFMFNFDDFSLSTIYYGKI